jgi:hypothetical protein
LGAGWPQHLPPRELDLGADAIDGDDSFAAAELDVVACHRRDPTSPQVSMHRGAHVSPPTADEPGCLLE